MLLAASLLQSCQQNATYTVSETGVVVPLKEGQVRLQVLSPSIIRVSATPSETFSTEESLSVIPLTDFKDWKVEEAGDDLVI